MLEGPYHSTFKNKSALHIKSGSSPDLPNLFNQFGNMNLKNSPIFGEADNPLCTVESIVLDYALNLIVYSMNIFI